jgi:hypothetical protein
VEKERDVERRRKRESEIERVRAMCVEEQVVGVGFLLYNQKHKKRLNN